VGFVLLIDRRGGLYRHLHASDSTIDQPERGCTVVAKDAPETERAASEICLLEVPRAAALGDAAFESTASTRARDRVERDHARVTDEVTHPSEIGRLAVSTGAVGTWTQASLDAQPAWTVFWPADRVGG